MADQGEYFWCLKHHAVEGAGECRAADHLGPYPTPQAAAEALDTVAARNAAWDNDQRFNDDDDGDD